MKNQPLRRPIVMLAVLMIVILICLCLLTSNGNCKSHSVENCPVSCVVCPPCEVCSSISCQTERFCESIGFDRDWYIGVSSALLTLKQD